MEFRGEFESHLTVLLSQPERLADLERWAKVNGLKCLHIVLDRGRCVSQPMLTRRGQGTLSAELAFARCFALALNADGFEVARVKLEASVHNEEIPQTDAEAAESHTNRYFEHHVKLLLDKESSVLPLTDLAQRHGSHLSRNALCRRSDGLQERFITQRLRGVGRTAAQQLLKSLVEELTALGQNILSVEEEYVVYDSNESIDGGWIEKEA